MVEVWSLCGEAALQFGMETENVGVLYCVFCCSSVFADCDCKNKSGLLKYFTHFQCCAPLEQGGSGGFQGPTDHI